MSRIMPMGSVSAELPTGLATMALLSVVVMDVLPRLVGEFSVAVAVAMVFS